MAQVYAEEDVSDFDIGERSKIYRLGLILERDGSTPYCSVFLRVGAVGSAENLGTDGRLRIAVRYTDGTVADLASDDAPLSNLNLLTDAQWAVVGTNGKLAGIGITSPTAARNVPTAQRLTFDSGRQFQEAEVYWTAD